MKAPRRGSFDGLPQGYLRVPEVAHMLNVTRQAVYGYCHKGILRGGPLAPGSAFLVTRASVEAALARIEGRSE